MVSWYKHDIPAWMDGTEGLSGGAYRAYHVIIQLIYLNEGPIALNERGLAGRCCQSIRAFRTNLNELFAAGKLTLIDDRLFNARADVELKKIGENRINAGKGGVKSGKSRKAHSNILKCNSFPEAPLADHRTLIDETKADETRVGERHRIAELQKRIVQAFEDAGSPNMPEMDHVEVWLTFGYDPAVILAEVREGLHRNKSVYSLKYFDNALREAHEKRAPHFAQPTTTNWEAAIDSYKASGNWPLWAPGAEPGMAGCCVPCEILIRRGLVSALEE